MNLVNIMNNGRIEKENNYLNYNYIDRQNNNQNYIQQKRNPEKQLDLPKRQCGKKIDRILEEELLMNNSIDQSPFASKNVNLSNNTCLQNDVEQFIYSKFQQEVNDETEEPQEKKFKKAKKSNQNPNVNPDEYDGNNNNENENSVEIDISNNGSEYNFEDNCNNSTEANDSGINRRGLKQQPQLQYNPNMNTLSNYNYNNIQQNQLQQLYQNSTISYSDFQAVYNPIEKIDYNMSSKEFLNRFNNGNNNNSNGYNNGNNYLKPINTINNNSNNQSNYSYPRTNSYQINNQYPVVYNTNQQSNYYQSPKQNDLKQYSQETNQENIVISINDRNEDYIRLQPNLIGLVIPSLLVNNDLIYMGKNVVECPFIACGKSYTTVSQTYFNAFRIIT
jgi:hypothetical protein